MKVCRLKIITANIFDGIETPQIHYVSQNKKEKIIINNNNEKNSLINNIEENKEIKKENIFETIEYKNGENNNIQKDINQKENNNTNNMDVNIDINDLCSISNKNLYEEQMINNIIDNNYNPYTHLNNNYPYAIISKKKGLNNSLRNLFKNRETKINHNRNSNKSSYKSLSISKHSNSNLNNKIIFKKNSNNSKMNINSNQSINKTLYINNSKSTGSLKKNKYTIINKSAGLNNQSKKNNILRGTKKTNNMNGENISSISSWKIVEKNEYNIGQTIDYKTLIDDLIIKECQLIKEKEQFIEIFEQKLKPLRELNQKLMDENNEELSKEDELNGELILLKNQYENLFNLLNLKDNKDNKNNQVNKQILENDEFNKKQKEIEDTIKIYNEQLRKGEFILITYPANYHKILEKDDKNITLLLKGLFFSKHILDSDIIVDLVWKYDKQFQTIYFIVEELINYFNLENKYDRNILINYFYSFCKNYNYMNINQFKIEFKKKIGTIKIFNKYIFMSKLLNLHKTKIKSMMNIIIKKDIFNRGLINYNKFFDLLCDNGIIFNSLDENFQEILEFLIFCMKKNRKLNLFENDKFLDNKTEEEKKCSLFDLYYESLTDFIDEFYFNNITNPCYLIKNYMNNNDIINAEKIFKPIINEKNILIKNGVEYIDIIILTKYLKFKGIIKNDEKISVNTFEEELVDIKQFINDIYDSKPDEEKNAGYENLKQKADNLIDEIFKLNY